MAADQTATRTVHGSPPGRRRADRSGRGRRRRRPRRSCPRRVSAVAGGRTVGDPPRRAASTPATFRLVLVWRGRPIVSAGRPALEVRASWPPFAQSSDWDLELLRRERPATLVVDRSRPCSAARRPLDGRAIGIPRAPGTAFDRDRGRHRRQIRHRPGPWPVVSVSPPPAGGASPGPGCCWTVAAGIRR